ncbi:MAG: phospho-sugar mutase, partial [Clostridia bacterium]|nr:phospho-sugar mutase [Clostridia bacterium]
TGFERWLTFDSETKAELEALTDPKEIEDRFYKNLEFGTGGMRGIMGAGPNRMNRYTVAKATKGLADYLKSEKNENSVAIAYDSRNNSRLFAEISACVLAKEGIAVHIFDTLQPTPVLSYAVRSLGCDAGIVVTASHNPKEYNGYKVYDRDGCQLVPKYANWLIEFVNAVSFDDILCVKDNCFTTLCSKGAIKFIDNGLIEKFIDDCKALSLYRENTDLKIVYTPLHGTGNIPVRKILSPYDVTVVSEQEMPDGNFSTVRSPNPEEKDALNIAIKCGEKTGADLVIGTDPDCDRVGAAVRHGGEFILLTGNQTGLLLLDFILKMRKLPAKPAVVNTIVTGSLGADIAKKYGCALIQTLTGFKYIGEKICQWERSGEYDYVFGYEESYGYLAGPHVRDKDAVSSSMLIAEMAAYYKASGKTLIDALGEIYAEYGFCLDSLETLVLKGKDGAEKIRSSMELLRKSGGAVLEGVSETVDYSLGIGDLPKENVLRFIWPDGSWAAVRPSGTEPKLKMYFSVKGADRSSAAARLEKIKKTLCEKIN